MSLKSSRNILTRQIATQVQDVGSSINFAYAAGVGLSGIKLPAAFTTAQLVSVFEQLPTVVGTPDLDIIACAGTAALTNAQKLIATGKGWVLVTEAPGPT